MKMKKITAFLLSFVFIFSICSTVKLSASSTVSSKSNATSYYADIYDSVNNKYICENRKFTIHSQRSIIDSLSLFADEDLIEDYTQNKNNILSIKYKDGAETTILSETDTNSFFVKVNGKTIKPNLLSTTYINDGDIIEWVYGKQSGNKNNDNVPAKSSNSVDTELLSIISDPLNNGCEWLDRNSEQSPLYVVAVGAAGRTVSINSINKFLTQSKKVETTSVAVVAQESIMLSFSGYGLDNAENKRLLDIIFNANISGDSNLYDCIYSLLAYDTANYILPSNATNTRESLLNSIINAQRLDGGFGTTRNDNSDVITTALVLTAISPYKDRTELSRVVSKAIVYLSTKMNNNGSFISGSSSTCETTARVIIALNSLGITYKDDMFYKSKYNNPIRVLLSLKNDDGGFSKEKNEASNSSATELAVLALSAAKKNSNPYILVDSSIITNNLTPEAESKGNSWTLTRLLWSMAITFSIVIIITAVILITRIKSKQSDKKVIDKIKKE